MLIYSFITQKTVFGRHVYAFGGNEKAAKLSGIDTDRVFFLVYANMGLLAAVAGLVFAGRLNAASPKAGTNFELDAIAACFIGGASASGGIGTVVGAIIGGLATFLFAFVGTVYAGIIAGLGFLALAALVLVGWMMG